MAIAIQVNGSTHSVDVDGDTPLLWVLRDVLGMTGTKFGCGMALCGACTVHVDGVAVRSASPRSTASALRGHHHRGDQRDAGRRQDPEGLARPRGHVQCGYCQSGQIMSASALLASNPGRPHSTSMTRCPATSAAGPMCASAKRSSRPRNRPDRRLTMNLERITSPVADRPGRSHPTVSRRAFLQVGAAAGGGLMLSLRLPLANGQAEAAGADGFAPNAFIRIERDGQSS
jgi:isoquinoline 1-oxidoreductase alpha subunit